MQKHTNKPLGDLTTGRDSPGMTSTVSEAAEPKVEEVQPGHCKPLGQGFILVRELTSQGTLRPVCQSSASPHSWCVLPPCARQHTRHPTPHSKEHTPLLPHLALPALFIHSKNIYFFKKETAHSGQTHSVSFLSLSAA